MRYHPDSEPNPQPAPADYTPSQLRKLARYATLPKRTVQLTDDMLSAYVAAGGSVVRCKPAYAAPSKQARRQQRQHRERERSNLLNPST